MAYSWCHNPEGTLWIPKISLSNGKVFLTGNRVNPSQALSEIYERNVSEIFGF